METKDRLQEVVRELSVSIEKMNKVNDRMTELEEKLAKQENGALLNDLKTLEAKFQETIEEYRYRS